jgi:hypothetical protein
MLRVGPLLDSIESQKLASPAIARTLLRQLVSTIIVSMLRTGDFAAIAQFMVREQQRPTAAFDLLYDGGINRLHDTLTRLFAAVMKLPPDSVEAKVRTHALFGELLVFRIGRALLLRRMGWKEIGPAQLEIIERSVLANLDALCAQGSPAPRGKPRETTRTRQE